MNSWGDSWGSSWGNSWSAVETRILTDTLIMQKPVDYFMPGLPQYRDTFRTRDVLPGKGGERTAASHGGSLRGPKPSFAVRTDNKGYD